jgi:uncharacterized protein YecE (DUF72 family)
MTKRWATITPDNFRFAAKFPRSITHEKRLADPEKELRYFFLCHATITPQDIESLATTAAFLDSKGGYEELEELIPMLNPDFRYAIEVRHTSWFDNKYFNKLLSKNNIRLAWSQLYTIQTPPELTPI